MSAVLLPASASSRSATLPCTRTLPAGYVFVLSEPPFGVVQCAPGYRRIHGASVLTECVDDGAPMRYGDLRCVLAAVPATAAQASVPHAHLADAGRRLQCTTVNGLDADSDGICGKVDKCPLDAENDADGDSICKNTDSCPYDALNDFDSDTLCALADKCPRDYQNDIDSDGVCGDLESESCRNNPIPDEDSDGVCGAGDSCPKDAADDEDSDKICGDLESASCRVFAGTDVDGDDLCKYVCRCVCK